MANIIYCQILLYFSLVTFAGYETLLTQAHEFQPIHIFIV